MLGISDFAENANRMNTGGGTKDCSQNDGLKVDPLVGVFLRL